MTSAAAGAEGGDVGLTTGGGGVGVGETGVGVLATRVAVGGTRVGVAVAVGAGVADGEAALGTGVAVGAASAAVGRTAPETSAASRANARRAITYDAKSLGPTSVKRAAGSEATGAPYRLRLAAPGQRIAAAEHYRRRAQVHER